MSVEALLIVSNIDALYSNVWIVNPAVEAEEDVKENKKRPPNFIKCYRCGATKPFTEFYNSKATIDGYSRTCKECSKAQQTKYYYKRKNRTARKV